MEGDLCIEAIRSSEHCPFNRLAGVNIRRTDRHAVVSYRSCAAYWRWLDRRRSRAIDGANLQRFGIRSRQNFVHRDIKPSNILLQGQPLAALLADFGSAREVGLAMTPDVTTVWYRSPEMLVSSNAYGKPHDVWALGIIAVQMETGKPPFVASSEIVLMHAIFSALGTPCEGCHIWFALRGDWACSSSIRGAFGNTLIGRFRGRMPKPWGNVHGPDMHAFVGGIMTVNPCARWPIEQVISHSWLLSAVGDIDPQ